MNLKNSYKNIFKTFLALLFAISVQTSARADFSFSDMELKFAHVSDAHISDAPDTTYKVLSHSKELLTSAINEINSIKGLDFVVFTGDMVNEPTKTAYKDFFTALSKLNYPATLAFGNHDSMAQDTNNPDYLTKNAVLDIIRTCNPYQKYDKTYFAFSPSQNYRVIVLDTTMGYEHQSNGFLPDDQLNFLDNELNENKEKIVLIFHHHPVIEPFKSSDHKLLNASAYTEILKKYEKTPIAVFSGHYHAAKIVRRGNILFVTTPSLVTFPNAFRTVKITNYNDRVDFKFYFHETRLKEIQNLSRAGLIASQVFMGLPSDRENNFSIKKGYVPKDTLTKEEIKAQMLEAKTLLEEEKAAEKEEKAKIKAQKKAAKEAEKKAKKEARDAAKRAKEEVLN